MKSLSKLIDIAIHTDVLKSIRINLHYFKWKEAWKFPIIISYRTQLKQIKGEVIIKSKISPGMLLFGYPSLGIQDSYYERTIWDVSGKILLNGRVISIGRGTKFCIHGDCTFGEHFTITGRTTVLCQKQMTYGNDVLISWDVLIMDNDWHKVMDEKGVIVNKDKPVVVGDHVWIGCRSTILKGSEIPNNSVIAACSVISGNMTKEKCIYKTGGKILKESIQWER